MSGLAHACCQHRHTRRLPVVTRPQPRRESKALLFDRAYRAKILAWLAREEPQLGADTLKLWRTLGKLMTESQVQAMLRSGFSPEIQVGFGEAWAQYIERTLTPAWSASLAAAAAASGRPDLWATVTPELAQDWLTRRGVTSFAGYTERQAQTINALLKGSLSERLSAAQLTEVLKVSVGLTPAHATALNSHVTAMIESGASATQIRLSTALKADRLQQVRAGMIARTELASALNGGTQLAMEQASGAGLLRDVTRVWVAQLDARTCIVCETLDGQTTGLADSFPGGFVVPPAHPRCRCLVIYEEKNP